MSGDSSSDKMEQTIIDDFDKESLKRIKNMKPLYFRLMYCIIKFK
jgi:hypothetical protein